MPQVDVLGAHRSWRSLDEGDVFVLDRGDKIFVWQGNKCAPMEKAKAAQMVNDLTIAKHVDVEVLSQAESRSKIVVDYLGGKHLETGTVFECQSPIAGRDMTAQRSKKLFRLSDAGGDMSFDLVKEGSGIGKEDLHGNDVFILHSGTIVWVWEGKGASRAERAMWHRVVQRYIAHLEDKSLPVGKVVQGNEGGAFWSAVEV
jgi:gelsolin